MKTKILNLFFLFIPFMSFAQEYASDCRGGWHGRVQMSYQGNILKEDTTLCGFKYIQDLSDWVTLTSERFARSNANWHFNTASERLIALQFKLAQNDTVLQFQQMYIHYHDTSRSRRSN